jgi:hypothetical protein
MPHQLSSFPVKTDSVSRPSRTEEQSFFSGHTLPAVHKSLVREKMHGFDWIWSLVLLVAFILFVIVKVYSPRKLRQMFIAFVKPAAMNQLLREEYAFSDRSSILLLGLSLLIIPLFAYQASGHFPVDSFLYQFSKVRGLQTYLFALLFFFGAYLVKITVIRFLAITFSMKGAGSEYIYMILLFNKVAGLIMFPLVMMISFARQLNPDFALYGGMVILVIMLIYRTLRLIQIGISTSGVSIIYLFLYLCTLEILPFVVLIKLFMFSFS